MQPLAGTEPDDQAVAVRLAKSFVHAADHVLVHAVLTCRITLDAVATARMRSMKNNQHCLHTAGVNEQASVKS